MSSLTEDTYVCGVDDPKTGFRQVHDIGTYEKTKLTFDVLVKSAKSQGLNDKYLFHLPYPIDDETAELMKIKSDFMKWLYDTCQPLLARG